MASRFFVLIFLGAMLMMMSSHAGASKNLVDKICKTTTKPSFCLNFLNSDPNNAGASAKKIAKFAIQKTQSNAKATAQLLESLSKDAQNNPRLKEQYDSCKENIDNAIAALGKAKKKPSGGDLNNFVSAALTDVDTCGEDFITEPPKLKDARQELMNMISVILAISNY